MFVLFRKCSWLYEILRIRNTHTFYTEPTRRKPFQPKLHTRNNPPLMVLQTISRYNRTFESYEIATIENSESSTAHEKIGGTPSPK